MHYAQHHKVGQAETLPPEAIEISAAQYREALGRFANGERAILVDGALTYYTGKVQRVDANGFHIGEADGYTPGEQLILEAPDAALLKPKWDGVQWIEGATQTELDDHAAAALSTAKQEAKLAIDGYANETRQKFASDIAFQLEAYLQKGADADAFLALAEPRPDEATGYPWLAIRLEAMRVSNPTATATDAANDIITARNLWRDDVGAKLKASEQIREMGKAQADAATSEAAVEQIVQDAQAEFDAL